MNILIITQWFNPEPNNMKALVFAKGLRKLGNNVEVITGFPNYPTGIIYDGYKLQKYLYEEMDGIPIHRVMLYPSHDSNKWKRMLNYFSFGISVSLLRKELKYATDVIYVYHPPITSVTAARLVANRKKVKILMDINDLWPDSIFATGMMKESIFTKVIDVWCKYEYRKADRINVLSNGIKSILLNKGIPESKISTIPVWCNEELLSAEKDQEFGEKNKCSEKFTLVYVGAVGKAQALDTFVYVAEKLRSFEKIQIIIVGTGTEANSIKTLIDEKKLDNIKILPNIPPERVVPVLNCADALLIHLADNELFKITIPSKIPLYLATHKPIIAGLNGDAAEIIRDAKCGVVCEPEDIDSIAKAIVDIYNSTKQDREDLAENGYLYYQRHMSISSCIEEFNNLFKELIE